MCLDIAGERTVPALFAQHLLEFERTRVQRSRVLEDLGALGAVGKRDDEREAIAFHLLTDLAAEMLTLAFVEPDHVQVGGKKLTRRLCAAFSSKQRRV